MRVPSPGVQQKERPDARQSISSILSHQLTIWPALAAVLGLILFVPTYLVYSEFYGYFGLEPDEVGLSYSTVLGRQAPWLLSAGALLLVAGIILVMSVTPAFAAHPFERTRTLRGRDPSPAARRVAVLSGLCVMLTVFGLVQYQLEWLPVGSSVPLRPSQADFFRARTSMVEVHPINPNPTSMPPPRLLYLGASGDVYLLYHPRARGMWRLSSSSYLLKSLDAEHIDISGISWDGLVTVVPWGRGDSEPGSEFKIAGLDYSRIEKDSSCRDRWEGGSMPFLGWSGLIQVFWGDDEVLLYDPSSYELLNAELIRAGVAGSLPSDNSDIRYAAPMAWSEIKAALEATRDDPSVPIPFCDAIARLFE